ncbi:MAG TPA: zinc-ribbon domain-containing protein [Geobacterales bacterium]|nr:zinc-ribbon domain-containing protein [Geobacterales bacterium]
MVVQCEACRSKFNLDDARIPTSGLKVRCSKCSHIFMIKKGDSAAATATAAAPSSTAAPRSSFDFGSFNTKNVIQPEPARTPTAQPRSPEVQSSPRQASASAPRGAVPTFDFPAQPQSQQASADFSAGDFDYISSSRSSSQDYGRSLPSQVVLDSRGSAPSSPGSAAMVALFDRQGLTDDYVVKKVHEVCEATRNVEGHEKPDWPIRIMGLELLCKLKGLIRPERKEESAKQMQIVTGIKMQDL